jgi:hypothetical protein
MTGGMEFRSAPLTTAHLTLIYSGSSQSRAKFSVRRALLTTILGLWRAFYATEELASAGGSELEVGRHTEGLGGLVTQAVHTERDAQEQMRLTAFLITNVGPACCRKLVTRAMPQNLWD